MDDFGVPPIFETYGNLHIGLIVAPPIQKDYDRFTMVYPLKIRICQIAFAGSI